MFARLFVRRNSDRSSTAAAPRPDPLADFAAKHAAYHKALGRRDTRAQHDRWEALRDAMNARLEARV